MKSTYSNFNDFMCFVEPFDYSDEVKKQILKSNDCCGCRLKRLSFELPWFGY